MLKMAGVMAAKGGVSSFYLTGECGSSCCWANIGVFMRETCLNVSCITQCLQHTNMSSRINVDFSEGENSFFNLLDLWNLLPARKLGFTDKKKIKPRLWAQLLQKHKKRDKLLLPPYIKKSVKLPTNQFILDLQALSPEKRQNNHTIKLSPTLARNTRAGKIYYYCWTFVYMQQQE